jgi:tetratricopeptide (TPR) repeat protein
MDKSRSCRAAILVTETTSGRGEGVSRAYGLLRAGQKTAAVDAIRVERARDPASTYLMAVEADVLWRAGRMDAAEDLLGDVFARDPGNRKALVVKADILMQQGAEREALTLLGTHPDRDAPHLTRRLVTVNFRLKRYREALALAQKVLQAPDRGDPAWFKGMAARCLEKLGDTGQAVEFWQDSKTPEARMKVIRLKLQGLAPAVALKELQQMARLERYDRDADFHALWAEQLAAGGRLPDAAGEWHRAADLRPGNAYYVKRAAFALQKAGRQEEALARFKEAVLMDPLDLWARQALYRLLAARPAEGTAYFRELLRVHPGAGWAHGYLKKLLARESSDGQSQ